MYKTILHIALICSLMVTHVYASDPFATLFGDEPMVQGSSNKQANQDDLLLVRFMIDEHLIDDGWVAYQTSDGICLPLKAFTDAMELPFTYDSNHMSGWVDSPDRRINVALSTGDGLHQTKTGWCGTRQKLEALFPIHIQYQASTLALIIEPIQVLPVQARLQRLTVRQELLADTRSPQPNYTAVNNPYRWFSWPTIDITLDSKLNNNEGVQTLANIDMAADLLLASANLRTVSNKKGFMSGKRLNFFRENSDPTELGWLKARSFAVGDVSAPSQPLINRSLSGRGFVISNRPLFEPEEFDQTTLRGILPVGWEAELYSGSVLVDFVTESDVNGEYVFNDVSLRPGFNRLSVKLYGPHGEEIVRNANQFVGSELCPPKKWRYNLGFIEPSVPLFSDKTEENNQLKESSNLTEDIPYMFASFDYGVSNTLSIRSDMSTDGDQSYGAFSLINSRFGGYGVLRMAVDQEGHSGWQAQFQKPISPATSFSLSAIEYGDLTTKINGAGQNRVKQSVSGRLDSRLNMGRGTLNMRNELNWLSKVEGAKQLSLFNRLSGFNRLFRWNNSLRYFNNSGVTDRWQGEFLASHNLKGARLRNAMAYSYENSFKVDNVSLSVQKKFHKNTYFQNSLNYDFNSKKGSIHSALSHNLGPVAMIAKAGYSEDGQWNVGVGVSVSLYRKKRSIGLAPSGLSRSGVIMPRLFDDANENGHFDAGESTISGGQFIVNNALRNESGNAAGETLISALPTARHINAEIKTSSLADPFMRPSEIGRSMHLRPGQLLRYDVPISVRGDAGGVLMFRKNGILSPVANIKVEAVNKNQQVIATARTEYDGYFYFDDLPTTKLTLRAAAQPLAEINGTSKAVMVELTRDQPSVFGIELVIDVL